MKTKSIFISITILSLVLYGVFCFYMKQRHVEREKTRVANHAKIISKSVWALNPDLARDYLQLAGKARDYTKITVYSAPEKEFIHIENDVATPIDQFLEKVSLVESIPLSAKIEHKEGVIGEIQIEWYNKNFYNCLYGLVVLLLLLTVLWFLIKNIRYKAELEINVKERTSELVNEIKVRVEAQNELEKEINERKEIEKELMRLTNILETTPDLVSMSTIEEKLVYMNSSGRKMLGWGPEEPASERKIPDCHPVWAYDLIKTKGIPEAIKNGSWIGETALSLADGAEIPVSQIIFTCESKDGQISHLSTIMRDISPIKKTEEERSRLQVQLRQSQKMDAVGKLAGGIAHDFNNLLESIMVCTEMMRISLDNKKILNDYVNNIDSTCMQASELINTLLTFSRDNIISKENCDTHESIRNILNIIERTIDKRIKVTCKLNAKETVINNDQALIQTSIMNLLLNSRDAMPDGGNLKIETRNVCKIDPDNFLLPQFIQEKYIEIKIADNGIGMDSQIIDHVFEHFFTTKDVGKGTGLGLSVVYQAVKENDGSIDIKSEKGKGTTIKLYFPIVKTG